MNIKPAFNFEPWFLELAPLLCGARTGGAALRAPRRGKAVQLDTSA